MTVITLLFSISLLILAGAGFVLDKEAPRPQMLDELIRQDVQTLKNSGALPKELSSLSTLELHGGTETSKSWIKEISFPFPTSDEGTHTLEILIVDWSEGPKEGALVQYNLVENASGNMIWELGRTFILADHSSTYFRVRGQLMNWLRH